MERREKMIEMRNAGLTYAEIGRRFGISRQAASYVVKGIRRYHKPPLDSKLMITPKEAALLIGVHPHTVRSWSKKGIFQAYRISPRGDRRYRRADIERFLEEIKQ